MTDPQKNPAPQPVDAKKLAAAIMALVNQIESHAPGLIALALNNPLTDGLEEKGAEAAAEGLVSWAGPAIEGLEERVDALLGSLGAQTASLPEAVRAIVDPLLAQLQAIAHPPVVTISTAAEQAPVPTGHVSLKAARWLAAHTTAEIEAQLGV